MTAGRTTARRRRTAGVTTTTAAPRVPEAQAMFAARRTRLLRAMRSSEPAAAIFVSATEQRRNGDVDYEFRQASSFQYLTGFPEPEAVAVIRPGHAQPYVLFVRPHDPETAVWVGPRAGVEGAMRDYGADAAYSIEELEQRLPELLAGVHTLYFSLGSNERIERLLSRIVAMRRAQSARGVPPIARVIDPYPLVARLRLVKSPGEVAALQRAIDITGAGIEAAIRFARPGHYEYEVQAVMEAEYRRLGSPRNGVPSIVAGGANACTLHYTDNRGRLGPADLLLLDTGAEWDYYSADVSRTFPVKGRFTPEQRAVYDIVLEAQQQAMALVRPGARFNDVHERAVEVLTRGLRDLKVLRGRVPTLLKRGAYAPYYMHATSHWLGLDVHDAGNYREGADSITLRPGMVLTVEPGLYITPDAEDAPAPLRGIGVRIEDDVLVTGHGYRNLSEAIPRDPATLEAITGTRGG